MSILFYKQRHRNPNFKDTAGANYAHIRYIATRPRVMENEAGSHGLFGKLEQGTPLNPRVELWIKSKFDLLNNATASQKAGK